MADVQTNPNRAQDELLPFLNNFHDIFTTIGVLILFTGLGLGVSQVFSGLGIDQQSEFGYYALAGLLFGVALIAWLLSSVLVGRQRRILPGIFLCLTFVFLITCVAAMLYTKAVGHGVMEFGLGEFESELDARMSGLITRADAQAIMATLPWGLKLAPAFITGAFLLAAFSFYRTYYLPFAGGLTGLGFVGLAISILLIVDPYTLVVYNPLVNLAAGLALFLTGIVFDMRDPQRNTRLSGTAFWLHFFAAPTLLQAAIFIATLGWRIEFTEDFAERWIGAMAGEGAASTAAVTLAVIAVFAVVSLLINRRALIVAGLITTGISIGVLVTQTNMGAAMVVTITLLVLGAIVVLLGAAWRPARAIVRAPFPRSGFFGRLFPPLTAD